MGVFQNAGTDMIEQDLPQQKSYRTDRTGVF